MRARSFLAAVLVIAVTNVASADTIRGISIDFVPIGNAGNAGDTRTGTDWLGLPLAIPYGCGAVSYNYCIGKYEVTNAQWNAFTTAAGAPTGTNGGSYWTGAQQPTNMVSWYEAAQFCNYLTSGDKSKGAYRFSGNNTNPGSFLSIDRTAAEAAFGTIYVIPTEDEWYKAAYFKPDGSGYSRYANGTDIAPVAGAQTNYYSFNHYYNGQPWNLGSGEQEQNGTFDMMGNVFEWNETLYGSDFGMRGGSYYGYDYDCSSSWLEHHSPNSEGDDIGFRVASVVPEPATLLLLGLGAAIAVRKRKI